METRRAVIGLGANLGDRRAYIEEAVERLRAEHALTVLGVSPIYETAPVGGPPQGDYLNAAALVAASIDARGLLERLQAIERALGRVRVVTWGPRTIDLDLLWIEGEVIMEEGLIVPHPRLTERPFALRPLLDVAPAAVDARTGQAYAALAAAAATLKKVSP